jgi:hypothetical protein
MTKEKVVYNRRQNLKLARERLARLLPRSVPAKNLPEWLYRHTPVLAFVLLFSIFSLYTAVILGLKAHDSIDIEDTKNAFDFLAYVFPCFAGIAAGYGIYKDKHARPLFALSCVLLAGGLSCHLAAHVSGHVFMAVVLCMLLIGPYIALANEARLSFAEPADGSIWILRVMTALTGVGVICLGSVIMEIGSNS